MTPVDQTIFGGREGNCFAACVATILRLPLEDVPNFCAHEDWFARFDAWLRERGLWPLKFDASAELIDNVARDALGIVSGEAERGLMHATVWRGGAMVHDPHPSRAGLLEVVDVIYIVPLDPGAAA